MPPGKRESQRKGNPPVNTGHRRLTTNASVTRWRNRTSLLEGGARYTCLDRIFLHSAEITKRKVTPPHREFKVDDHVFVRGYNKQKKWEKAKIVKRIGRLLYIVRTEIGMKWKRHVDQIRPREIK
ncbi:hypothetical protein T12_1972 [Trichinella patagoniensis]|uniref:Uncharacterized protein n=1 Tax=Trichinella patagoniensis TaxID=990121 RepID=A0A0V0ZHC2_9BILA|nr:hypothetical protein T12_9485 [Trichinella patagoniensis]KRY13775.1 hypothetical protein T12_1972 [Trichinella patagoniensis]